MPDEKKEKVPEGGPSNDDPKPFVWTKSANTILAKPVRRLYLND